MPGAEVVVMEKIDPHGVGPERFLLSAVGHNLVRVSSPVLARLAGVRQQVAWEWIHGRSVDESADRRLRQALGLTNLREEHPR